MMKHIYLIGDFNLNRAERNDEYYNLDANLEESDLVFVWINNPLDKAVIPHLDKALELEKRMFIATPGYFSELYPVYQLGLDCVDKYTPDEALKFFVICDTILGLVGNLHCESPVEKLFWDQASWLIRGLWPQVEAGPYRMDFGLKGTNIGIEIDGHDYHKTKQQRTRDAERQRYLEYEGWRIVRFTGSEVYRNSRGCAREAKVIIYKWLET